MLKINTLCVKFKILFKIFKKNLMIMRFWSKEGSFFYLKKKGWWAFVTKLL